MRKLAYLLTGLAVASGLAGCSRGEEGSGAISASSMVSEIPITTSSEEALAFFKKGEEALDIGGPRHVLEANAAFRMAVEKDPGFAYAYLNVANSAQSVAEFNEYMDLAVANTSGVSEGEKLLIDINTTFLINDAEKRSQLARELVKKYPSSPRAWLSLSGVQTGLNQSEDARASANKAVELDPNFHAGHSALGFSYLFNEPKDFGKAEHYMRRVIELIPDESMPQVNLGDVRRADQDLEGARKAYTKAVELDRENGVAMVKKGHVNSFLGNYDEARADYDQSLVVASPNNRANYANYRAFIHIHAGHPAAAIQELTQIVESAAEMGTPPDQLNGSRIFALSNVANIALHNGMLDEAERALTYRAELLMDNASKVRMEAFTRGQKANIAMWQGLLAARAGDYEKAVLKAEENERLLEPDDNPRKLEGYHYVMGLQALLQGKNDEAVQHLRKANHLNNIYVKYHLGLALEGAGDTAEAHKIFKEVAEWNFNSVGYALVRKDAKKKAMMQVSMQN